MNGQTLFKGCRLPTPKFFHFERKGVTLFGGLLGVGSSIRLTCHDVEKKPAILFRFPTRDFGL
jgi:hypothetical protein